MSDKYTQNAKRLYEASKKAGLYVNISEDEFVKRMADPYDKVYQRMIYQGLKSKGKDYITLPEKENDLFKYIHNPESSAPSAAQQTSQTKPWSAAGTTGGKRQSAVPLAPVKAPAIPTAAELHKSNQESVPDYTDELRDFNRRLATPATVDIVDQSGKKVDELQIYPLKNQATRELEQARHNVNLDTMPLAQLKERYAKVTQELDDLEKKAKENLRYSTHLPGQPYLSLWHSKESTPQELETLRATRNKLQSTKKLIEEAIISKQDGDGVGAFFRGVGRGISEKFTDSDTWSAGLKSTIDAGELLAAAEAADKGTATKRQMSLLEAAALEAYFQNKYKNDIGYGYEAGGIAIEAIPFMLEMGISPLSGAGKALAKQMTKTMVKKYGAGVLRKNSGKYIAGKAMTRLAGNVGGAAGMAATSGIPGVAADAKTRETGQIGYKHGDDYTIDYDGRSGGEDKLTAYGKAFAARTIENLSEMLGGWAGLEDVVAASGKAISKNIRKAELGRQIYDKISNMKSTDVVKVVDKFLGKTQWHGTIGEFMEEMYGGAINAVVVGDQTLDTDEQTGLFNQENLIRTALGVGLLGGVISSVRTGAYFLRRDKEQEKITNADTHLRELLGDEWKHIKEQIESTPSEQQAAAIANVLQDKTPEVKSAMMNYYLRHAVQQGLDEAAAKREQEAAEQQEGGEAAEQPGLSGSHHRGSTALRERNEQELTAINDEIDLADMRINTLFSDERERAAVLDAAENGSADDYIAAHAELTEEQASSIKNLESALETQTGIESALEEEVQQMAEEYKADRQSKATEQGLLIPIILEDGRHGWLKSGDLSNANGTVYVLMDGSKEAEQIHVSKISQTGTEESVDEAVARYTEELREQKTAEVRQLMSGQTLTAGKQVQMKLPNGNISMMTITGVQPDNTVTLQDTSGQTVTVDSQSVINWMSAAREDRLEQAAADMAASQPQTTQTTQTTQTPPPATPQETISADEALPGTSDAAQEETPTALSTIPVNEEGEPIYESVEPGVAWDALMEQTDGNEEMAASIASQMISDKQAELKTAERQKTRGGRTVAEKIASEKERMARIEQSRKELAAWEAIAGVSAQRKAAVVAEQERAREAAIAARKAKETEEKARREEAERIDREALTGVPDMIDDTPQAARARGYRRVNGHKVERQGVLSAIAGKDIEVKFSNDAMATGKVAVIEAETLQPSHIGGQRNAKHFIDEAQPKERKDQASMLSAQKIADNIRPEEITTSVTAYTGAPTVNRRGEAIQGNSRSDALKQMWHNNNEQAAKYKQYLIDHAEEFGLRKEDIEKMEHPVLVNMIDVEDDTAISLGQYVAQDTESGGSERIKAKNTLSKMGSDIKSFANILLKTTNEEASFAELLDNNGVDLLKWMRHKGYITDTQYANAFDSKGNLTGEAKNDLRGIMYQSIFAGGSTQLEEMFNAMPAKAQKAILATAFRDYDSSASERMIDDIQDSIRAYYALSHDAAFASAKNYAEARMAIEGWKRQYQMDDVTGESYLPSEKFSNFALLLAAMYKGETQRVMQESFNLCYDHVQGTQKGDMFFAPDNTPKTLAAAVKETYNIDYDGRQREKTVPDMATDGSTAQRQGRDGAVAPGRESETTVRSGQPGADVQGSRPEPESEVQESLRGSDEADDRRDGSNRTINEERRQEDERVGEEGMASVAPASRARAAESGSAPANRDTGAAEANEAKDNGETKESFKDRLAAAKSETEAAPTASQKKAGNYKKGHIRFGGYAFTIETPQGVVRSGVDKGGKAWAVRMPFTYGYILGREGKDGDNLDMFINDAADLDTWDGTVYIVDQVDPETGEFDEHKVMYGFVSAEDAIRAYQKSYSPGWQGLGKISGVSKKQFDEWVASSKRKQKPFHKTRYAAEADAVTRLMQETRQRELKMRALDWIKKTGVKVVLVDNIMQVKNKQAKQAIIEGKDVRGWYETDSGEVYIYLPNTRGAQDIDETIIHEVVAHHGLRSLLGEETYDKLCDQVWDMMSDKDRQYYERYPGVSNIEDTQQRHRASADEYIAALAESIDLTGTEKSSWQKIVDLFRLALEQLGIKINITDEQLSALIRASYAEMVKNRRSEESDVKESADTQAERIISGVNADTLTLAMSQEEFEDLLANDSIEDLRDYARLMNDSLALDNGLWDGQKALREEYATAKEKYGGTDNIPADVMQSLTERMEPYSNLSNSIYDRMHAAEDRVRELERQGIESAKVERKEKENQVKNAKFNGFLVGKTPLSASAIEKTLNKPYKIDGEVMTLAEYIERCVEENNLDLRTEEVPKYAGASRSKWNKMDLREQALDAERVKNSGTKTVYFINDYEFNKTAYDYAVYLSAKQQGSEESVDDNEESEPNMGDAISFRVVDTENPTDFERKVLEDIETGNTQKVYRGMQVVEIDGQRYALPPMASKIEGEWAYGIKINDDNTLEPVLLQSDERPDLIGKDGKFKLDKGNGKSVPAAYNPYWHTSATMLNDQFAEAQDRPNLITVEGLISNTDLESGYKADKAKDAVGEHEWKAGTITGQLTGKRKLYLSRYFQGLRIVPDAEVAQSIYNQINGAIEYMPSNVVPPSVRAELEKLGVKFLETNNNNELLETEHKGDKYTWWYGKNQAKNRKKAFVERAKKEGMLLSEWLEKEGRTGQLSDKEVASADKTLAKGSEQQGVRFSVKGKKKSASETASVQEEHHPTVVSSADGAKILNNLDNLIIEYEKKGSQSKTFLGDIAKSIGATKHGSNSQYATFETVNGNIVTIRLADHNAKVSTFDNHGEKEGISIVVTPKNNTGLINDGGAHVVEYYYNAVKLRRSENKPLVEILKSIKQSLYSGVYKDNTGLAERDEANTRFRIVYHGSGADFEQFDHSHMGEGAGSQMFGWGTYVTESEKIGRDYGDVGLAGKNRFTYIGNQEVPDWVKKDAESIMDRNGGYDNVAERYFNYPFSPRVAMYTIIGFMKKTKKEDWQGNRHLYEVEIPDEKRGNYIVLGNTVTDKAADKVFDGIYQRLIADEDGGYDNPTAQKELKRELDNLRGAYGSGKSGIWKDLYGDVSSYLGSDKEASLFLNELGYVGIKYPAGTIYKGEYGGASNYVIFNDKDLKIAKNIRFRVANNNQEIFVSNAEQAVKGIKQEKATPQQWKAMIQSKGGLKAGEDKWLGLSEWLDEQATAKRSLTKQEVLDFIGENKIRIEEVEYSDASSNDAFTSLKEEYDQWLREGGYDYAWEQLTDRYGDDAEIAFMDLAGELTIGNEEAAAALLGENVINSTRLEYTTEGLENKREIALTVPTIESWNESDDIHFGDAGQGRAVAWVRFGETITYETIDDVQEVTEFHKPYENVNRQDVYKPVGSFKSGDYVVHGKGRDGNMIYVVYINDKQLPVAHATLDDARNAMNEYYKEHPRKLRKAQNILVIDEIQSKRHQEGREQGYAPKKTVTKDMLRDARAKENQMRTALEAKYGKPFGEELPVSKRAEARRQWVANLSEEDRNAWMNQRELVENYLTRLDEQSVGIPDAPFDKNWHELAMKRILRLAAEEGFDKVAWTKGEQQAERYNLSAVVDHISYFENEDGTLDARAYFPEGGYEPIGKTLEEVERNVGKDIAKKMQEGVSESTENLTWGMGRDGNNIVKEYKTISGDNLKVGGEGMKGFYDKMLPSFMNKYGKKWGVKVEEVELPEVEEAGRTMWSVDVTPEMKESVMEGQVMFRFVDGMSNDDIHSALSGISEWTSGAYDVMSALEEYYGGEIVHASRGARNAINEGRVPVPGPKYSGDNEEYHHFEFKNEDEETFVEAVPFVAAENVEEKTGIRFLVRRRDNGTRFSISSDEKDRIRRETQADGTYMKAPNGRPTRLEESDWLVSKTEGFREWLRPLQERTDISYDRSIVWDSNGDVTRGVVHAYLNRPEMPERPVQRGNESTIAYLRRLTTYEAAMRMYPQDAWTWLRNVDNVLTTVEEPTPDRDTFMNAARERYYRDLAKWKKANGLKPEDTRPLQPVLLTDYDADSTREKPKYDNKTVGEDIRLILGGAEELRQETAAWRKASAIWATAPQWEDYREEANDEYNIAVSAWNARRHPLSLKNQAWTMAATLAKARHAAARQKRYDRSTVKTIVDYIHFYMRMGYLDKATRGEVSRMLSAVKNVTGARDVSEYINKILNIVTDVQIRNMEAAIDKLASVRALKQNVSGFNVQGKLAVKGQMTLQVFKENRETSPEKINAEIDDIIARMSENPELQPMLDPELDGLHLAQQYVKVRVTKQQGQDLSKEKRATQQSHAGSGLQHSERKKVIREMENAIIDSKIAYIREMSLFIGALSDMINDSMSEAKEFREREKLRVENIFSAAMSDLRDVDGSYYNDIAYLEGRKKVNTSLKRAILNSMPMRFLTSSLPTFEQFMRLFGRRAANGEGRLYKHFMLKWQQSVNNEWTGVKEAKDILDRKVDEVFDGKISRWSDLYTIDQKLDNITLVWRDRDSNKPFVISQGQALYLYMISKMSDGMMKLEKMGIDESDILRLSDEIDHRLVVLADWLQEKFLPERRVKYNKVHERFFGAPMSAIEDYFPIRILSRARLQEEDVTQQNNSTLPGTGTGALVNRTKNSLPIDIKNANALSVVIEHIEEMEHWAAFCEFNKDLNTLLSFTAFRNKVQNMSTIYGTGEELWQTFKDSASLAAGVYDPKTGMADKFINNISHGIAASKIAWRLYTAIKQILSAPAFIADARIDKFAKNMIDMRGSWQWAEENMPMWRKRWHGRELGDTRLMRDPSLWKLFREGITQKIIYWGMMPNAFVDAVSCAVGARSVYESTYERLVRYGYSPVEARQRALLAAENSFNLTQQSNEGAYITAIQKDRTLAANMMTLFKNNSFAYGRQLVEASRQLARMMSGSYKRLCISYMEGMMIEDGLTEEQASAAARKEYYRTIRRNMTRVGLFSVGLTTLWNLGANAIYLLAGDDDDEKDTMATDAILKGMLGGPIEGLAGGSAISDLIGILATADGVNTDRLRNYSLLTTPFFSDIQNVARKMSYDVPGGIEDISTLLFSSALGVNPKTLTDAAIAIADYSEGDMETAEEIALLLMRIFQVGTATTDNWYIDELGLNSDEARKMSYDELARRYAVYKARKNNLVASIVGGDARAENLMKTFDEKVATRIKRLSDEEIEKNWNSSESVKERQLLDKELRSRKGYPARTASKNKEHERLWLKNKTYGDHVAELKAEDIRRSNKPYNTEYNRRKREENEASAEVYYQNHKEEIDRYRAVNKTLRKVSELKKSLTGGSEDASTTAKIRELLKAATEQ